MRIEILGLATPLLDVHTAAIMYRSAKPPGYAAGLTGFPPPPLIDGYVA